jgi:hypothetical protein
MCLALRLSLVLAFFAGTSCGGDSSPNDGTDPNTIGSDKTTSPATQSRRFRWIPPSTRINGYPLPTDDLQGYALVTFQEPPDSDTPPMDGKIPSLIQFRSAGSQLDQFIQAADVAAMVYNGNPGSIVILAPQTSITLEFAPGTHHVAISTFDWDYQFSELSNTVTFVIPP